MYSRWKKWARNKLQSKSERQSACRSVSSPDMQNFSCIRWSHRHVGRLKSLIPQQWFPAGWQSSHHHLTNSVGNAKEAQW